MARDTLVVERVGDLIHHVVAVLEKTQHPVVQLNAHIISILLQAD